jgi:hypothetical protein
MRRNCVKLAMAAKYYEGLKGSAQIKASWARGMQQSYYVMQATAHVFMRAPLRRARPPSSGGEIARVA